MATPIPTSLLREQWPTALSMAAGGAWSLLPYPLRDRVQGTDQPHTAVVRPGSDRNLDAYAAWAGAPPERYHGLVPPTSAARWAMPMISRLSAMAPHSLLKVVNQGVRLRTTAPLPRVPLHLTGRLVEVREDDGRVRIHSQVAAAVSADADPALTLDAVAAVVTGPRSQRRVPASEPTGWRDLGRWAPRAGDGRDFFLLTGDFNPIHTSATFAARTRFGGPILHGFGTFARTYEVLVDALGPLADVEVRFVAPVPLPGAQLTVQHADDGSLRVVADDGTVHLAGRAEARTEVPA